MTGDPDLDRSLANATAIIRRALPFTVYKPPGIVSTQNEYIYIHGIVIVATEKGLPPIDILRRMFMDKTDQQLLEMDKETVSLRIWFYIVSKSRLMPNWRQYEENIKISWEMFW